MKFDVIIMNPPYQLPDGGNSNSAVPLYNHFVEMAIDRLTNDYILAITPSRWMIGGKGLDNFRQRMIKDKHIKIFIDDMSPFSLFEGAEIMGGVSYFLWDKKHNGECEFNGVERFLDEEDIVVRENESRSILNKVKSITIKWVGDCVSPLRPYGLRGDVETSGSGTLCWFKQSVGLAQVDSSLVKNPRNDLHLWKVLVPRASMEKLDFTKPVLFFRDNIIIAKPNECCTETYIVLRVFSSEQEAQNFVSYVRTIFFRFMLRLRVVSQDITRDCYKWVPDLEDYSKLWSDEELFDIFEINKQEQDFIFAKIKISI